MSQWKNPAAFESLWDALPSDWASKPWVRPGTFEAPALSPDETLRGLKVAFSRLQAGDPGARPRCYVEAAEVMNGAEYARFIPTADDTSLDKYAARLSSGLSGKGFGVVVNAFHVHYPVLWHRLRAFFRGLNARQGLPASKIDPVLFFGNYPVTPFGVHTDEANVFTFNLATAKRVLAWPRAFFSTRGVPSMDTHLLAPWEPYEKDAVDLRQSALDLMYWPASHWHVGISKGELLCTLGVGAYASAAADSFIAPAQRLVMRESPRLSPLQASDGALPPELERALKDAGAAALRREVQAEWMRRVSADGLLPAPPVSAVSLTPKDRVQKFARAKILHATLSDGFLFAAEGQSWFLAPREGMAFDATHAAPLIEAFTELNTGEPVRVGQLSKKSQGMGAQMVPVLEALAGAGALEKL
jgi:hypothetical protein